METAIQISQKTTDLIQKLNEKANGLAGYNSNDISRNAGELLTSGSVEVGYRSCCGTTDKTHKVYKEWLKVLKALKKDGLEITEENQKHKNAYATNNGGFWNSTIFRIKS